MDSGNVSRDQLILEALRGAKVDLPEGSSAEDIALQQGDREYLSQKTDIGTYFSVIRGLSDLDEADAVMQLFQRGDQGSIAEAFLAADAAYTDALAVDGGDFLIQLVGIVPDPIGF